MTEDLIDLIANEGRRNAAGGIYSTRVYEFANAIEAEATAPLLARIAELEARIAANGAEPVACFINDARKGETPHYAQIDPAFKSSPDVFPLYRAHVADSAMAKDAEAFRLMVKNRLLVGIHLDESWAQSYGTPEGKWLTIKEKNGDDAAAAARRAIERAAAAIAASAEKGDKA
ncbi:hypothetical protein VSR68_11380 [Paraburkholderia phymatum]|uniref:hypothetical protein n=1 Tax=Paraburkholderia phymatum TaxID=148447 RepID=UPI00317478D2